MKLKLFLFPLLIVLFSLASPSGARAQSCAVDAFGAVTSPCPSGYAAQPICDTSGQAGLCLDCQCKYTGEANPTTMPVIGPTEPAAKTSGFQSPAYCDGGKGINTALGCISFEAEGGGFVRSLLAILIGLGGGVALLLILYGIFIVTTSAGIPDKLNQGKEIISSAVAGLVFIILAIFLMQLIGVQILNLPGL